MSEAPIGISDFGQLRECGMLYVDKSRFIDDILSEYCIKAFMIQRPKGFGKSLNLSMLDAYLNLLHRGNRWFDGLEITRLRPDDPEKNSNPVIHMDLSSIPVDGFESFIHEFSRMVSELYSLNASLLESDSISDIRNERFGKVMEGTDDYCLLQDAPSDLARMLEAEHGRQAIVLIDGCDCPVAKANGLEHRDRIVEFLRGMMVPLVKGNPSVRFSVLTCETGFARESVWSGLNNLWVAGIFGRQMEDMFGFTRDEVDTICGSLGHPKKTEEAWEWYGGYRIGDAELCHPGGVMEFIGNGLSPAHHGAEDELRGLIDALHLSDDPHVPDDMETLMSGGTVRAYLDEWATAEDPLDRSDRVYTVMAMRGYFRAEPVGYAHRISIPNRGMYEELMDALPSDEKSTLDKG